jgi:hypothetical protein
VLRNQPERAIQLILRLAAESTRRQDLLAASGHADIGEQRTSAAPGEALPYLLALLDRWEGFASKVGELDGGTLQDTILTLMRVVLMQTVVPLPRSRALLVTCSSPVLPLTEALLDVFDAVSGTLRVVLTSDASGGGTGGGRTRAQFDRPRERPTMVVSFAPAAGEV